MDASFFTEYAWVLWLSLILVFVIVEISTVDFTFLMLAVGSLGGLLAGLLGAPWWLQIVIAGVLALVLVFFVRPPLKRLLHRSGDKTPSNVEALLGLRATVTIPIADGVGQVKLANGETWTAALSALTENRAVQRGESVVVTAIEGATAVVVPAERTAQ
jgi:membrane protein implicated in regulation of membrane protease activity